MAQIGSWATVSSIVGEYESSLAQTEGKRKPKYDKNLSPKDTKEFFAQLLFMSKLVGDKDYGTDRASANKFRAIGRPIIVYELLLKIDKSYRLPKRPERWTESES